MYTSHYMEEVEEICSRIIIIDKGKTIAAGSKEELKAGIMMKEKIEVEQVKLQEQQVQDIQDIANVFSVQYNANVLQVKFTEGKRNLANLLDYFTQENICLLYTSPSPREYHLWQGVFPAADLK